ncbi:MAG: hypothetical protein PGMFKBFP_03112 [Anaerolineales bacterium]|nr:hypothetical protein [Anaerolineales bacterium]
MRNYYVISRSYQQKVARQIYRKAKQVSSVTYNLFTIAKKLDSEPPVAGMSAPVAVRESVRNELIKQFPTMESLFGSMDFCECDHCRSVLSPAAYLVDLLQFVDTEPGVWGNFLAQWKATHGNQDYPHKDKNGTPMKPYDVLVERRPDLPHIALTCKNTHTALPYIDIVNEILEYYVAHGRLEKAAAHNTGDATTAELLAEPQNVIRGAYDTLRDSRYPLKLPFDLWIETVRQFCNYFETPLHRVLEVLRPGDDLFSTAMPFDRSSIFLESLGLSPAEVAIFTDTDPLATWHELYGFSTAAEATTEATDTTSGQRIDLNSAKALSRRLGVSYKEITEIVETGFVNPELSKLSLIYKLGVNIRDARLYKDHKLFYDQNKDLIGKERSALPPADRQRFDDLSKKIPNTQLTGWEIVNELETFEQRMELLAAEYGVSQSDLRTQIQNISFHKVLVLADPDAGCNFDLTTLRYANDTKADPIVFLRINLFVRLWRKLGWSIEETDRALQTFVPKNAPFEVVHMSKQPLKTALIYLAHLKVLDEKLKVGKQSRLKLLTLWSDIATTGKKPLYAQLFLTRSVLKSAPMFDHPLGLYLSVAGVKLKDHLLAVQGALSLTADEISSILADAGKSLDTAELSLPHVSLLYRYGLLAKALRLTVRELIAFKQLCALDPFKSLHPDPLANLNQDYPFLQTMEFIKVTEEAKDSGLKIEDLEYLLRHRFDETGKYRPDRAGMMALLRSLSDGIRAIRTEHAVPEDPGALSDEVLRQKLGLALPPDVVETFLAMMNGTAEFTATRTGIAQALDPKAFEDEPSIRQLTYNATRQEQKLTFRGVLFEPQKNALKARLPKPAPPSPHAPSPVFEALLDDVQAQARSFFDKHLLKQSPGVQPASGFLDAADYDLLFAPTPAGLTEAQQQARARQQRTRLAQAFLPFLQERLIRQFIVQTITAQTGADPTLVESLLTDERLLAGPKPLLDVFADTGERGVTATFFASTNGTGASLATGSLTDADTGSRDKDGNPLKPANTNSALFEGYLEVQTPGAYRFYVALDKQNAEAELRFDHLPDLLFWKGAAAVDNDVLGDQPSEFLELKPGIPYRFRLDLKMLNGGEARLQVQGENLPKGPMTQLTLYPAAAMDASERASTLLNKALQLVQGLGLSEREIRYLLTHAGDFGGVSLSELPTQSVGDTAAEKTATEQRFARYLRLAAYARLKRDLASGTDDLIGIFEANPPVASTDQEKKDRLENRVYPLIAKVTRRNDAMVKAAAEALVKAPAIPAFESEKPLCRLWEALQVVERFGVPPASLLGWTGIVNSATTADRRFEIARDLKETIKARSEPENWQRVAQPIFDKLRQRQRDALVSHVMHQHGFDRMEQLYEYFLIDPGMEPVVQTSRIRLAISSLQLFIQRCLLNLELKVHPSTINAKQWEWMKRYRVWEANRKIFLFPENWLEPEFRDDKTHLFAELEGALLQGDVSSDLVEDAFLNYLKKLDELARLDIVAMHIEDNPDPARRILHVFGRTYSTPHKYFYRRYAHQQWTPWEPVSAEIEGDHLAPVVWRDRLYLFWVAFMEKVDQNTSPGPMSGTGEFAKAKVSDVVTTPAGSFFQPTNELAKAKVSDVVTSLKAVLANKQVDVQLHWSEYLQGEWTTRESGGFFPVISKTVPASFTPSSVFIHVSKEPYEDGEERGVYIHMGGDIGRAFYLAGRNSSPESESYNANSPQGDKPANPYNANTVRATRYYGNHPLNVTFTQRIATESGKAPTVTKDTPSILHEAGGHILLPCNNNLTALGVSEDAYRDAANPDAVKAAIESGLGEIASLIKPVFYQDNRHTLFVEPNVTELTIEEWKEWVTRTEQPERGWSDPGWWNDLSVKSKPPGIGPIPVPEDNGYGSIDPGESRIKPKPDSDWLVNPATVLKFDDGLIGPDGQSGLEIHTAGSIAEGGLLVNVNPGSGLGTGSTVILTGASKLEQTGLTHNSGGLNVVGVAGLNSALKQNFNERNRSGFGASAPGGGRMGR